MTGQRYRSESWPGKDQSRMKGYGAVSVVSIVIHFDVFEHRLSHVLSGGESLTVNELDLERVKETLGAGIIVTTAFRTHAAQQTMLLDQRLVGS